MKKMLVALLFASQSAFAFLPAPGLWQSGTIDGQGFNIETQNNIMIVTSYVFDASGKPIWYLSAGAYDESLRTFTATFANATGGSCLACAYKAPAKNGNAGGDMKIVFTSREAGTIFFQGGSRQITHLNFGYGGGNTGYFYGEWQFSFNIHGLVTSQWIVFSGTTFTGSDGTIYAVGNEDSRSGTTALASYIPSIDEYLILIDDGTGYQFTYEFKGDQQRMIGQGWIEPSGVIATGTGSVAVGNRILTQSELANPSGALFEPDASKFGSLESTIRNRTGDQ